MVRDPFTAQLGRRIKARRLELKLTQDDLGNLIGVSGNQIADYEAGRVECKVGRFADLCAALRVEGSELLSFHFGGGRAA